MYNVFQIYVCPLSFHHTFYDANHTKKSLAVGSEDHGVL